MDRDMGKFCGRCGRRMRKGQCESCPASAAISNTGVLASEDQPTWAPTADSVHPVAERAPSRPGSYGAPLDVVAGEAPSVPAGGFVAAAVGAETPLGTRRYAAELAAESPSAQPAEAPSPIDWAVPQQTLLPPAHPTASEAPPLPAVDQWQRSRVDVSPVPSGSVPPAKSSGDERRASRNYAAPQPAPPSPEPSSVAPVFFTPPPMAVAPATPQKAVSAPPVSLWRRIFAYAIDLTVWGVAWLFAAGLMLSGLDTRVSETMEGWAMLALFVTSVMGYWIVPTCLWGSTLGKAACRYAVVSTETEMPPTFWRAVGRALAFSVTVHVAALLSAAVCAVLTLTDPDGLAPHDRMSRTRTVPR